MKCRFCGAPVSRTFVDLGVQPLSNAYVDRRAADQAELFYPLHAFVCDECLLVQLAEFASPEKIFSDYAYLSSMSDSWLDHCRSYAANVVERFGFDGSSLVVEVASNDGYLLRFFKDRGIPVLGIEPAANVAAIAEGKGIPSIARFFGTTLAQQLLAEGRCADLVIGNNVLAHVPDLNDFVRGLSVLLAPDGVLTMEFPHVARLLEHTQFDTIYHEHFSYFSFATAERVLKAHGLVVFDVDELATHGGSLRIYAGHEAHTARRVSERVPALHAAERKQDLHDIRTYARFPDRVHEAKRALLEFLIARKREGKHIIAYGAPAKGNTLLNYCGVRTDFIDYAADRSPLKQGKLLPGTRIPIEPPERIKETRPDYVLVLPWNIQDEIARQLSFIKEWGGKLVVPIPKVAVLP
jgi:2-polyprenyl-3-methyl-5-hydroxy-6-metoxy-1,4-benzoquinol methylase